MYLHASNPIKKFEIKQKSIIKFLENLFFNNKIILKKMIFHI